MTALSEEYLRRLDAYGPDDPRTQEAFDARLAEAIADEDGPGVYYLSFVDPDIAEAIPDEELQPGGKSWLGGCFVRANGPVHAMTEAHRLGCNPGGQIATWGPFDESAVRLGYMNRLFKTVEELDEAQP